MLKTIIVVLLLMVAIPIAFITTILIHPFWRWFEAISGIESFGHSGPAGWCYWFDYVLISMAGGTLLIYIRNRKALRTEKKEDI